MVILSMITTTLLVVQTGQISEVELLVPSDRVLQECAGEIDFKKRQIDLSCKTMAGDMVHYTLTGAYSI